MTGFLPVRELCHLQPNSNGLQPTSFLVTSGFLILVVRPGAPSSFLLLVAMPFAPSSFQPTSFLPVNKLYGIDHRVHFFVFAVSTSAELPSMQADLKNIRQFPGKVVSEEMAKKCRHEFP